MRFEHVDPKVLKALRINPETRTSHKAMDLILASIRENGFYEYCPILINGKYEISDGHRRVRAAIELGIEKIPAIIEDDLDAMKGWGIVNITGKRSVTQRDILIAYSRGMDQISHSRAGNKINQLRKIGGMKLIHFLADNLISPSILTTAQEIARYVLHDSDEYICKIIYWLVHNHCQRETREAIQYDFSATRLKGYIDRDQKPKYRMTTK